MNFERRNMLTKIVAYCLALMVPMTTVPEAYALPHLGKVSAGTASVSVSGSTMKINQKTTSATFNWNSYNVASGQSVLYTTPTSSSVSLNYIGGTTPSSINGIVKSNGILYFMNPNGIIFGSGASVSAAGVMAYGASSPWGAPTGTISNAGVLTATNNGTVALVGTSVTNSGTISAPGGEVILGAGSSVTPVTTTGSSSVSALKTAGGGFIDNSGLLSAQTDNGKTGTIIAQAGMNSGTVALESSSAIDASAPNGGNGGNVTVNAHTVKLDNIAPINVSAPYGDTGSILVDPTILDIGTAAGLELIDGNGNVDNQTPYLSDDINLTANINMSTNGVPYNWIPFGAPLAYGFPMGYGGIFNGNNHTVSGYTIGTSTAPYSGSYAGFITSSGGVIENLGVSGSIYVTYPSNYAPSDNVNATYVGGVVGHNNGTVENSYNTGDVTVNVTFNNNSGANGYTTSNVGGVVGLNYANVYDSHNTGTISVIVSSNSTNGGDSNVGGVIGSNWQVSSGVQYDYNTGNVSNVSNNTAVNTSFLTSLLTGGVIGDNYDYSSGSVVQYLYNKGNVTSIQNGSSAGGQIISGGIVGYNDTSMVVQNSYNAGSVSASGGSSEDIDSGGIVGWNNSATSTVENSYNTGNVSVSSGDYGYAGGIVGLNGGIVEYVYNTGSVSESGNTSYVGGIIGYNGETLENSYNLGGVSVTGTGSYAGGLIGYNWNTDYPQGLIKNNYYNTSVSYGSGAIGYNGSTNSLYTTNNTGLAISQFGIQSNLSNLGSFNTWNSTTGVFNSSVTSAPWYEGQVVYEGGTTTAPMLIPAMPTYNTFGNGGGSIYNGSTVNPGTTSFFDLGGTTMPSGVSVSVSNNTAGPNVGTTTITPTITQTGIVPNPTSQTSVYDVTNNPTSLNGSWTISPLTITSTANSASFQQGQSVPSLSGTVVPSTSTTLQQAGLSYSWTTTANSSSSPGTYAINPSFSYTTNAGGVTATAADFNFVSASSNATAMTVTTAPLIVTATAFPSSMTEGQTPSFLSGYLNLSNYSNPYAFDIYASGWKTTATSSSPPGQYAIDPSGFTYTNGASASDYTIVDAPGNATAMTVVAPYVPPAPAPVLSDIKNLGLLPVKPTINLFGQVESTQIIPSNAGTTSSSSSVAATTAVTTISNDGANSTSSPSSSAAAAAPSSAAVETSTATTSAPSTPTVVPTLQTASSTFSEGNSTVVVNASNVAQQQALTTDSSINTSGIVATANSK